MDLALPFSGLLLYELVNIARIDDVNTCIHVFNHVSSPTVVSLKRNREPAAVDPLRGQERPPGCRLKLGYVQEISIYP